MKTYPSLISDIQSITFDTNAESLVLFKAWLSESVRKIMAHRGSRWPFLQITKTKLTASGTDFIEIPNSIGKLMDFYVTDDDTIYRPKPVFDYTLWKNILSANLGESDIQDFYYIEDGKVYVRPAFATTGNIATFVGRRKVRDMVDDTAYSTGTVSVTVGSAAIIGSGTTFTRLMEGQFIRLQNTGSNTGDGMWYEIETYNSATSITLTKAYEGITASAQTFSIEEAPPLPDNHHELPMWRVLALHYQRIGDQANAKMYWYMYDGGVEAGYAPKDTPPGGGLGLLIDEQGESLEGVYISPNNYVPDNLSYQRDEATFS